MAIAWALRPMIGPLSRDGADEPTPGAEPPLVEDPRQWDEFYRELDRARRHERTFAIARVPLHAESSDGTTTDGRTDGAADDGVDAATVAERLRDSVRLTDRVWVDGDNAFVLMPESDRRDATIALPRAAAAPNIPVERIRVAVFPEDGVTSGAVLGALARPNEEAAEIRSIHDGASSVLEPVPSQREAG